MKATKEQAEAIRKEVEPLADAIKAHAIGLATQPKYQAGGTGNLGLRIRFDSFYAINREVRETVANAMYKSGGNDEHIDTLLRSVFRSIPTLEQFAK